MTDTAPEIQNQSCLKRLELNIVGEDHSESEPDRDRERTFVKRKMGKTAKYWTETDFSPGRLSADSMELRCAQSSAELIKRFALICGLARVSAKVARTEVSRFERMNCVLEFFKILDDFIQNLARLRNVFSSGEVKPELVQLHSNYFEYVYNVLDGLKKVKAKNYMDYVPGIEVLAEYGAKFCESSTAGLAEALGITATDPDALEAAINRKRSLHMLEMANEQAGNEGVWKVGEQHVKDMLEPGMTSAVNIVTRDDFRREFETYFAPKKS